MTETLEHLYSLYSQSSKNKRELDQCSHDLQTTLKRICKVFTIRWVASSFRALSAVWHSFPALAQHFDKTQMKKRGKALKRPDFEAYCPNFVKNLAKKAMLFQQVELREGRSPVTNQAQFIRAVADNMKERLFTTASSRAQPSVHATRRENYKTLVGQIDVLDAQKIDHDNPRFGENEAKSLCGTLRLSKQQTHLAYIEFKASGGRSIPDQLNKLMVAVDTLSPSNADCERGFSAMNNIITDSRNAITTNNSEK